MPDNRAVIEKNGWISMSWAPEDAREVGHVLKSAGLDANGKVQDRGFYEDGVALIEAADACVRGNSKPGEERSGLSDVVALVTLQRRSNGKETRFDEARAAPGVGANADG